jgi:hypothetical protein
MLFTWAVMASLTAMWPIIESCSSAYAMHIIIKPQQSTNTELGRLSRVRNTSQAKTRGRKQPGVFPACETEDQPVCPFEVRKGITSFEQYAEQEPLPRLVSWQ